MKTLLLLLITSASAMKCINYYGMETEKADLVCRWKHEPWWYLDKLKFSMGVDTVRVPFSYDYIQANNFTIMDTMFVDARRAEMKIILDYHRTNSSHQSPHPDAEIDIAHFAAAWTTVIDRYVNNPALWALDLFNEPQDVDNVYLNNFYVQFISYLEMLYPKRFVYFLGCEEWGSKCQRISNKIPGIEPSRVKISIHLYPFSVPMEKISQYAPNGSDWVVGETGYDIKENGDFDWFTKLLAYLKSKNVYDVCLWTIAHSADTGGWFEDDCETLIASKVDAMKSFWSVRPPDNPVANNQKPVNVPPRRKPGHHLRKLFIHNNDTVYDYSSSPYP